MLPYHLPSYTQGCIHVYIYRKWSQQDKQKQLFGCGPTDRLGGGDPHNFLSWHQEHSLVFVSMHEPASLYFLQSFLCLAAKGSDNQMDLDWIFYPLTLLNSLPTTHFQGMRNSRLNVPAPTLLVLPRMRLMRSLNKETWQISKPAFGKSGSFTLKNGSREMTLLTLLGLVVSVLAGDDVAAPSGYCQPDI